MNAQLDRRRVAFTLNGSDGRRPRRRDHHRGRRARRHRDPAPVLQGGHAARRQLPRLHGRDQGRARAGAVLLPLSRRQGMEVTTDSARAVAARRWCSSCCCRTCRRRDYTLDSELDRVGRRSSASASRASPRAHQPRAGPLASGDGGEPRRLHPVHALRARLPRRAGERRHRLRLPRRARRRSCSTWTTRWATSTCVACGECVQACPTGALMPARDVGTDRARQEGRLGLPVLRRRLPAHLQRQGQQDPVRRGPRRPGEPRAACASRAATASTTCTTRSA